MAITQLQSGELRAGSGVPDARIPARWGGGAVKVRRPRADTRVGGAKRRALHGAEHSSKLGCVMVAGPPLKPNGFASTGRRRDSFPGRRERVATQTYDRRARRTKTMDTTSADNLTDGQWGVSDPRVSALGRSRRAKGWGRSRPSPSALTHRRADCGQQRTPPARRRPSPQPHASPAVRVRQPRRESQPREGSPLCSRRRRRGTTHPESFIPPDLRSSASDLPRKNKEMLVGMRQLQALDARAATVQGVTRNR